MDTKKIIELIENGSFDEKLIDIYVDTEQLEYQKKRYIDTIFKFEEHYGAGDVQIFSAPGRSEIGGNHTDHQHGKVLACAINRDAIGVVKPMDGEIRLISDGSEEFVVDITDIAIKEEEKGTTLALIKGVVAGLQERNYKIGGFQAYITSDVLIGSGVSSSAAFETLIGSILSGLYNEMTISSTDIAIIGQYAENVYFGKPCGLMDQMACSTGSLVYIDFYDSKNPVVEKVAFDMESYGYSLCITDTKGSHADLTDEYAAVPSEMNAVAEYFGKLHLRQVDEDLEKEVGKVFIHGLEDAGVYKCTEEGRAAFERFIATL